MRALLLALLMAANEPVGIVRCRGSFSIHGHKVWYNATVVERFGIQSFEDPLDIWIRTGERWRLAAGSSGHVLGRRFVLEEGTVRGSSPVECNGAVIEGGLAQVSVARDRSPLVLAAEDSVKVPNTGVEVRRVSALPDLAGSGERGLRPRKR